MTLFLSTFVNKIDKKGRISVPAPFRAALREDPFQGIVLFRSYKWATLDGCAMARMHQMSQSLDALDLFSEDQDAIATTIFADAEALNFDGEGRIMLPEAMMVHAGLQDQAAFVGRGPTFQIWKPEAFRAAQDNARQKIKDKGLTLPLRSPLQKEES